MTLRAKSIISIGFLGLLCFLLPGSLRADTLYTYTGAPYVYCVPPTICTGTTPFLTMTLDVVAGTPLDNLPPVNGTRTTGTNIVSDVSAFSFSDQTGLSITQTNANFVFIYIGTNGSGDITSWDVNATSNWDPGSGAPIGPGPEYDVLSGFSTIAETQVDDSTTFLGPPTYVARGGIFERTGTESGTWVKTPEPSALLLLLIGTGLLGLWALTTRSKPHAPPASC
jgi:hypothetical protein